MLLCAAALCAASLAPSCRHRTHDDSAFEIRVYSEGVSGFGYALYQGDRKVIDQPNIPAIPHILPFRSRKEAEITAQLVKQKLQTHQFPPAVTLPELDSLQISYRINY